MQVSVLFEQTVLQVHAVVLLEQTVLQVQYVSQEQELYVSQVQELDCESQLQYP